jgi:geranylgeranyl pyrophosphate synthase
MTLATYLDEQRRAVDGVLQRLLPEPDDPSRPVAEAMRYAVLGPGKRLRPILVLAAHEACGGFAGSILEPAAALELIHAYSLVHDDLPAMDDDDLRRGRPTVHRVYGEAQAILAGDGLLTLAFEVLASWPRDGGTGERRAEAVRIAAARSGIGGMVGGQAADLSAEGGRSDRADLQWIHRHKTGALFAACAEIGAVHAGAPNGLRAALAAYGEALGWAFQITDDVLDRTASRAALGKTPGKDERTGKTTYPAVYGLDESRRLAEHLVAGALEDLRPRGVLTDALEGLARHAVSRTR